MQKAVFSILFILSIVSVAVAATDGSGTATMKSYYSDAKDGWWWYKTPPPAEEPQQEEAQLMPEPEKTPQQKPSRRLPSLADYTKEQLWYMHPDDFQELLKDFLKKAVQYPTPENVREYLYMQDIARRKSAVFTNVSQYVIKTTPELNILKDSPVSAAGIKAVYDASREEKENFIRQQKDDFAILYFYSPTCKFCKIQEDANKGFIAKFGWEIKRINILNFPDVAEKFGVKSTPTLYLIYRYNSSDYIPVGIGHTTTKEMVDNVYNGIRLLKGEVTPENLNTLGSDINTTLDPTAIPDFPR
jgi:conjugal transfer pilus assembly protein TraF